MDAFDAALNGISGGRVLDVATGRGNFVQALVESLKDFVSITGIDTSESGLAAARQSFPQAKIDFRLMDAGCMEFEDASFDTVCLSNSLHHLRDRQKVLNEMLRVLKPGGRFILSEMYCDGQTETQQTHVLLHHWWGRIDTAQGVTHDATLTRNELQAAVEGLGLAQVTFVDAADLSSDPKDPELLKELEGTIDRALERLEGPAADLLAEGEYLRRRLYEVGLHWASVLLAVGEKRGR